MSVSSLPTDTSILQTYLSSIVWWRFSRSFLSKPNHLDSALWAMSSRSREAGQNGCSVVCDAPEMGWCEGFFTLPVFRQIRGRWESRYGDRRFSQGGSYRWRVGRREKWKIGFETTLGRRVSDGHNPSHLNSWPRIYDVVFLFCLGKDWTKDRLMGMMMR